MNELDKDAVRTETITRLVDLAIADATRGTRVGMAVEDLVGAAGADPALLQAAADAAEALARTTPADHVEVAVVHLRAALRYVVDALEGVSG